MVVVIGSVLDWLFSIWKSGRHFSDDAREQWLLDGGPREQSRLQSLSRHVSKPIESDQTTHSFKFVNEVANRQLLASGRDGSSCWYTCTVGLAGNGRVGGGVCKPRPT